MKCIKVHRAWEEKVGNGVPTRSHWKSTAYRRPTCKPSRRCHLWQWGHCPSQRGPGYPLGDPRSMNERQRWNNSGNWHRNESLKRKSRI